MKHFIVLLKDEPNFIKCLTEEEALEVATEYQTIVNCIVSSETPIHLQVPEMRMGFAPSVKEDDVREIIGEKAYSDLVEAEQFAMIENKEVLDGTPNK